MDKKDKKKTLTISTNLTKKIDISNISKDGKKSFSIEKKVPFKSSRNINNNNQNISSHKRPDPKKNLNRKFIEQQATKAFIKNQRIKQQVKKNFD